MAASAVAMQAPSGKPPPIPLASAAMSGVTPACSIAQKAAGAADAGLHLVQHQQQAMLVAERAQADEKRARDDAHAAFALNGLDQYAGGVRADQRAHRVEIAEGRLIEAVDRRAEAVEIFGIAAGGDGRQRAAVEGALECDQPIALGAPARRMIFARRLDRAFDRLGARIGEEGEIGEGRLRQPFGEPLGGGDAEQIGDVPRRRGGGVQGSDEMRMRMAERIDRDAGAEVEIAFAIGRDEPSALAALEGEVGPRIGRKQRRNHEATPLAGLDGGSRCGGVGRRNALRGA